MYGCPGISIILDTPLEGRKREGGVGVRVRRRDRGKERENYWVFFPLTGIPTLIIVDDKGEVITKNGRSAITLDPDGKVANPSLCTKTYYCIAGNFGEH